MYTEISSWQSRDQGAQIDLLIDRRELVTASGLAISPAGEWVENPRGKYVR